MSTQTNKQTNKENMVFFDGFQKVKLSFSIIMNRTRPMGFLFQKIKLAFGWGDRINKFDVARIVDMCYYKRLFRIFNRDKKYTLCIKYENPRTETDIVPVFTSRGLGVAVTESAKLTSVATFRCSEEEAVDTIEKIDAKLERLDRMQQRIKKTFMEEEQD